MSQALLAELATDRDNFWFDAGGCAFGSLGDASGAEPTGEQRTCFEQVVADLLSPVDMFGDGPDAARKRKMLELGITSSDSDAEMFDQMQAQGGLVAQKSNSNSKSKSNQSSDSEREIGVEPELEPGIKRELELKLKLELALKLQLDLARELESQA